MNRDTIYTVAQAVAVLSLVAFPPACEPTVTKAPAPVHVADASACSPSYPCDDCNNCTVEAAERGGVLCAVESIPGCSPCVTAGGTSGTQRDGVCCGGCWAGPVCRERPDGLGCGAAGSLCVPCAGSQTCINGACSYPM